MGRWVQLGQEVICPDFRALRGVPLPAAKLRGILTQVGVALAEIEELLRAPVGTNRVFNTPCGIVSVYKDSATTFSVRHAWAIEGTGNGGKFAPPTMPGGLPPSVPAPAPVPVPRGDVYYPGIPAPPGLRPRFLREKFRVGQVLSDEILERILSRLGQLRQRLAGLPVGLEFTFRWGNAMVTARKTGSWTIIAVEPITKEVLVPGPPIVPAPTPVRPEPSGPIVPKAEAPPAEAGLLEQELFPGLKNKWLALAALGLWLLSRKEKNA